MKKTVLKMLLALAALASIASCSNKKNYGNECGETCKLGELKENVSEYGNVIIL